MKPSADTVQPRQSVLPPHLLERLGGLDLIARRVVRGFVAGAHPSVLRGAGEDFTRHRAYQQGDDLRHLDWKLYARTDRLHVREFRQASRLRAFLVVDSSSSMDFAEPGGVSKSRYAAYVAAALAHLMLTAGDTVGLASFGAESRLLVAPRNRAGHLRRILLELERLRCDGRQGAADVLDRVGNALRLGGRVVIISDLLEEGEGGDLLEGVGRLRARGDEVMVLRIATPLELGERPLPPGLFYDPENPMRDIQAAPALDPGYSERVAAYYSSIGEGLRERGAEYVPMSTSVPVENALAAWLRARGG